MSEINLLYIDLFCGAGGTSTGVESARIDGEQCAKVIACVNHDTNAIASHAANHPEALHFTEDIRTLELSPLLEHLKKSKVQYPSASVVLWASLECTNFSKAKGGQPRDADSRTLAEHLFRYIEAIDPDYIQIENVEEFMSWGPMDENGKPLSMQKGKDYTKWVRSVKNHGYNFKHRIMNAADYGAYTSRKRFFGIFAKHGLPIVFPEPTHCKEGKQDMFSDLKKWKAVKEVLDFEDEGTSIFGRKKEPVEATKARLYSGLIKFVAGGKDAFMIKWNSMNQSGKYQAPDLEAPSPTVSCQNRLGVAKVSFMSKQFSGHPESKNVSLERPAGVITCIDHHAIVNADFLAAYYGNGDNVSQVDRPCPTVPTKDRFNYVRPMFLSMYYGGDNHAGAIDKPAPTIRTKDCCSLVSTRFFDMQYGTGKCTSIHKPAGTVTATPKHNLITCRQWLMNTSFGNTGSSVEVPSQVITANRKWHYLVNPQYSSAGGNINSPCFTLIARMDKMPPYLAECTTEPKDIPSFIRIDGNVVIYEIYETDSPMTVKIKEFMALYGILDIKMRMLKIPELKRIMGFPEGYKLIGTQADQKKFIGNAVEVTMARVLCEAVSRKLRELRKVAA
ncbi:DNA cytosine methyltransferase [Bacteroides sp.]|jgi:DNA (cytosine-5)-methyltransferase 1|uniref:DNA cytosine methyltransferase n=1 Tax=Bacteroides sp. TaxID=29523 RepID=UPI00258BE71A|nr:DNA cytosine methyltransferase [Bacteroides sp.]